MKWRKEVLTFLAVAGAIYAAILGLTYMTQDDQLYHPPPANVAAFDVWLERPDGVRLGGWIAPGPRQDSALVLFGGNAMGLAGWRNRNALAGCTDRTLILVPYRGYEGNPGQPGEEDLLKDGAAVLDWAGTQFSTVGVLGISLGSGVAVGAATKTQTRIDILALGTPFDRMDLVAHDLMPWVFPKLLMRDTYDSAGRIGDVQAGKIAVLRAREDRLIGAARTQGLLRAAPGAIETVVAGGHESAWRTAAACEWLKNVTAGPTK